MLLRVLHAGPEERERERDLLSLILYRLSTLEFPPSNEAPCLKTEILKREREREREMSQPLDSSGWSYVVSIPSWTTGSAQGEDNVVYYNVEVKISSITGTSGGAEGGGQQNVDLSRTVQRRFSDFRRLYDMLCMLYGAGNVEQVPDSQAADFTGKNQLPLSLAPLSTSCFTFCNCDVLNDVPPPKKLSCFFFVLKTL